MLATGDGGIWGDSGCRTVDCESRGSRNGVRPAGREIYVYATMISYLASGMKTWKTHTCLIEMQRDAPWICCDGWFGVESFRSADVVGELFRGKVR